MQGSTSIPWLIIIDKVFLIFVKNSSTLLIRALAPRHYSEHCKNIEMVGRKEKGPKIFAIQKNISVVV